MTSPSGNSHRDVLKPDVCVIGAGAGGLSVAAACAAFGASVVLVERGEMGGDCLNVGCVPSKALIAAAWRANAMHDAAAFGISSVTPEIDFAAVRDHVRGVIAAIAPNDSVARFTALGVHVIKAEGRFLDRRTLRAGAAVIRPRRFVVATGSSPAIPDIPGLAESAPLTNETIFDLAERPDHLVVIGAGAAGLELAQAQLRLGARVTVIEAATALGSEDRELAAIALERLRAEGLAILEHATIETVDKQDGETLLSVRSHDGERSRLRASHVLVAAGRRPNTASLDLDKAGVAHGPRGIEVGARLRSSNRRVYAVGDVAGRGQFTHLAAHHAAIVSRALLFRLPARADRAVIPRTVFTDPEMAQIGQTESEARTTHPGLRVLRWPFAENDRAQAERATTGLIKLVCDGKGRILGVSIVGAGAAEMANFWSLAITRGLRTRDIATFVSPYPTLAEIGKRAAVDDFAELARRPLVRRLIRILRLFG